MRIAIIIFVILFVVLLIGAIPFGFAGQENIFYSFIFIIPCLALCIDLIYCAVKRHFHWRDLGFLITHWGIILILWGAFLSFWKGTETQFKFPIGHPIDSIPANNEKVYQLGFQMRVKDFKVDYYPPVYGLYELIPAANNPTHQDQYTFLAALKTNTAGLFVDGYGQVSLAQLQATGRIPAWQSLLQLDQKKFLKLEQLTPSSYTALLSITDDNNQTHEETLQVNHPLSYRTWKFYLNSYDQKDQKYIVLSAYQDPGRWLVISGIWLVMISTFIVCIFGKKFFKQKKEA